MIDFYPIGLIALILAVAGGSLAGQWPPAAWLWGRVVAIVSYALARMTRLVRRKSLR